MTRVRLERGLPLLLAACRRAFERRADLDAWHADGLFGALSYWDAAMQFTNLQLLQRTRLDLREFLDGAAFAGTQQQLVANSRAFMRSALLPSNLQPASRTGEQRAEDDAELRALLEDVDDAASAAAAQQLETICCPQLFRAVSESRRRALRENNIVIEVQEVKVRQISAVGVYYSQLTDANYDDLVHGRRTLLAPRSRDASIEHLSIEVNAETTEVHKMTRVGEEVALVEQQNRRKWVFETCVTDPNALDWRMLAEHGENISARELVPRQYLNKREPEETSG